jgi:hypothetical protein
MTLDSLLRMLILVLCADPHIRSVHKSKISSSNSGPLRIHKHDSHINLLRSMTTLLQVQQLSCTAENGSVLFADAEFAVNEGISV